MIHCSATNCVYSVWGKIRANGFLCFYTEIMGENVVFFFYSFANSRLPISPPIAIPNQNGSESILRIRLFQKHPSSENSACDSR